MRHPVEIMNLLTGGCPACGATVREIRKSRWEVDTLAHGEEPAGYTAGSQVGFTYRCGAEVVVRDGPAHANRECRTAMRLAMEKVNGGAA